MIRNRDFLNCLPLLASVLGNRYGVKVRMGGAKAYTNGKTIQLPALPLDCDKTAIALAKGYIDHESAHIRFTDFGAIRDIAMLPVTRHLCNSIEDWRVEKCLAEIYPGCKSNLAWLIRHIFLEGKTEKAGNNPAFSVLNYVLLSVRSWEVGELKKPLFKIAKAIEMAFPGLLKELDKVLARVKINCPNTQAAVRYGIEITDLLRNYEQSHREKEEVGGESQGSQEENSQSTNQADKHNANQSGGNGNESPEIDETDMENQGGEKAETEEEETSQGSENEAPFDKDSECEVEDNQNATANCSNQQELEVLDEADKNARVLQAMLEASEDELPDNLGEILVEKLSGQSKDSDAAGIEVATCYDHRTDVLPLDEKEQALRSSNALRQRFAGLLQAMELKQIAPARRGKLNIGKLARLSVGNPKIFNREEYVKGPNAAVHILLDASYSMEKEPIKLARQACFAVAKALSTLKGINPAVTVFPADCMGGVYSVLRHGQKLTDRFLVEASGGTPLAPALWWVLQNICQLPETRKIVLVITDGLPDNLSAAKDAIKTMQKMGIKVYGIGISLEAVKEMLPGKSCVINGISELAPAMFGLLQETLLKGGCHDGAC